MGTISTDGSYIPPECDLIPGIKDALLKVPSVESVDVEFVQFFRVNTNTQRGDRNAVYEVQKQLMDDYPDCRFDFHVQYEQKE